MIETGDKLITLEYVISNVPSIVADSTLHVLSMARCSQEITAAVDQQSDLSVLITKNVFLPHSVTHYYILKESAWFRSREKGEA